MRMNDENWPSQWQIGLFFDVYIQAIIGGVLGFWTVVGLIGWIILLWLWVQPHHLERTVKSRKWNYNVHKTNDYQNKIFWNIIKFCKNLKTQIVTDAFQWSYFSYLQRLWSRLDFLIMWPTQSAV